MTTLAVEIHDAGLLTVREGAETELAASSPGYALLDGSELVLGRAARERARLQPRRVHHRFWEELDSAALPRPFPRHLTRADDEDPHQRTPRIRPGHDSPDDAGDDFQRAF